jgi:hypothetical protein
METHEGHDEAVDDPLAVDRLRTELSTGGGSTPEPAVEQRAERFLDDIVEGFLPESEFRFRERTVKENLGEVLLSLVAHRSAETNGKRLMEDLSRVFDADLSPGTVYPQLHDATEAGLLERHELVRTKEYHVDDPETVRDRLETEMRQHLVLGLFYHRVLEEL